MPWSHDSLDGDTYVHKLCAYVRRHEVSLANGLLLYSRRPSKVKPMRLSFTIHHLYYVADRIDTSALDVDVGPLNVKLDSVNHEPTFISFMANNARSANHFDSDAKSITSINSVRSIVSSASMYWRSYSTGPKVTLKDLRYLYSSFTKIPCLTLCPKTKTGAISGYEEYPCDTSVPITMFKNLQVLELVDYDPNEIFGWHILSDQLRILIIKNSKISDLSEFLFSLVIEDELGRTSFSNVSKRRQRSKSLGASTSPKDPFPPQAFTTVEDHQTNHRKVIPESKWSLLKQLTVNETSITSISSTVFKPLSNLVKLNLANNLLEIIPEGLEQLQHLRYLNFADNYITSLKNLPSNLKHLTTLNFNNNKISDISELQHVHTVDKIDLRRNELASIDSLKPIVLLFSKCKKFDNVYLANNKLAKGFRVDLFNLINGVQYKNSFKIDDSGPGYFESALLFDSESSLKNFERFFNNDNNDHNDHNDANDLKDTKDTDSLATSISKLDIDNSDKKFELSRAFADSTKTPSPLANNQNVTNKLQEFNAKLKKSPTMTSISDAPTSMVTPVAVTARMST